MSWCDYYTHRLHPINFVLGYCIPVAPDPVRIIGVQITELQLKKPNLESTQDFRDCFPHLNLNSEVLIAKERRSWKEKPLSTTEKLWSNLTGIQTFHYQLSNSQAHPDRLWNSWKLSLDLFPVPHSLVSCVLPRSLWLPLFPFIMSLVQCNLIGLPIFWQVERE